MEICSFRKVHSPNCAPSWNAAALVDITRIVRACRDPNDDKFLEVAVNGKADALVTGDADLLALDPIEGIPIIMPVDYLAKVSR